ncbi:MAG: hypothetical protein NT022_02195, partial [Deltaproteobacteria bacterium]|nr:hypothetical protein [Deltaproteobacteria bacterium]
ASNCKQLLDTVTKKEANYLVMDDGMLSKTFKPEDCPASLVAVKEFRDGEDFVNIYRLQNE